MPVRELVSADVPAITALYAHHVRTGTATFEEVPPPEAEMARRMAALAEAGLPRLVAEVEGRVVGFAYAGPYRTRSAYRFTVEDSIYLDPGFQRRGLGRALLGQVIERAQGLGLRQMIAAIGDSGNVGSIRLHQQLGFTPTGTLNHVGYKFERWLDVVMMQRTL
ncbi:GNAT family N-acetyltransferase [Roseospirillum parvum]|uniref:Phosphinothricin acetyltransferase n=1 Tax=Roseospirillum parvum TaxID=83401 RepID=A0A1G8AUB9_9PROT|nr:GNAT family N-acetyltransferase [Roseospirillum parvum]SDH23930.1 phosphinothricin acetyltransferase [Roseospirillum parvum]